MYVCVNKSIEYVLNHTSKYEWKCVCVCECGVSGIFLYTRMYSAFEKKLKPCHCVCVYACVRELFCVWASACVSASNNSRTLKILVQFKSV